MTMTQGTKYIRMYIILHFDLDCVAFAEMIVNTIYGMSGPQDNGTYYLWILLSTRAKYEMYTF